MYDKMVVVLGR